MTVPGVPLVRLLANPTSRNLLRELASGPSYPRALALRLGITEGQAQRRLRDLASAGLVRGEWHHDGKTVKRYVLAARAVHISLEREFEGTLEPPPTP